MDHDEAREPDALAQRAFESSKPSATDVEALSAMQSLQQRLFGVKSTPLGVGRYELVRRIGEGAMGVVYEARDPTLDRRVALKVMKGSSEDPEQQRKEHERVKQEATMLAKLSHPNIVEIFDVGLADGRSYIAMEYVMGGDLAGWLAAEPRHWGAVVDVFVQVGRGLAAAHAVGLIHRDVKPSNILIGDDGRVRVVDFGLATPDLHMEGPSSLATGANPAEALSTQQSRPGPVMGTLGYMAPEQFLGERVDHRVDIFGMCAALWEALYGTCPFTGNRTQIAMALMSTNAPRVDGSTDVPGWLYRVCRRGLAHHREQRWPSAQRLVAALEGGPTRSARQRLAALLLVVGTGAGLAWWWLSG